MGLIDFFKNKNTKEDKFSEIIQKQNFSEILNFEIDEFEDFIMKLMYNYFSKMKYQDLNQQQKIIYLCMKLEDACQADSILSLYENDMMLLLPEMYDSFIDIGANKTAKLIKDFIDILPQDTFTLSKLPEWDYFFEKEETKNKIGDIDKQISDYPDGLLINLYYKFVHIENNAQQLIENLK